MRSWLPAAILALISVVTLPAEDEGVARTVDLSFQFLPPPLEDTRYSIGVFEAKGRLVRRLHDGTPESAFPAALNGLVVKWDGKDAAGKRAPNGRYEVRGYAVGSLKLTGVAIRGNDWMGDDPQLRARDVQALAVGPDGTLLVVLVTPPGAEFLAAYRESKLVWKAKLPFGAGSGAGAWGLAAGSDQAFARRGTGAPIAFRLNDGTAVPEAGSFPAPENEKGWRLEAGRIELPAREGVAAREIAVSAGEPIPQVVASTGPGLLYVLEALADRSWVRVRGLELESGSGSGSLGRTIFERNIRPPAMPEADAGPTLQLELVKNPLARNRRVNPVITVRATADAKGTHLVSDDGLRLRTISLTPNIEVVALAKGPKKGAIRYFQRDAAAAEEFLVEGADQIMQFEVGRCELGDRGEVISEDEMEVPAKR